MKTMIPDIYRVCARCEHWTPVFKRSDDLEQPGACHGQTGKWKGLNGMWMKAADRCANWKNAPLKAPIRLVIDRQPPATVTNLFDDEVPF